MTYKTIEEINNRIRQLENEIDCLKTKRRSMGWRDDAFSSLDLDRAIKNCVMGNFRRKYSDILPPGYIITVGDIEQEMNENDMVIFYRNFGIAKDALLKSAMAKYLRGE